MIRFPIHDLFDEQKCYEFLVRTLHQYRLKCPRCETDVNNCGVHRRDRAPVLYYQCSCGRVFSAFTDTEWRGTRHSCSNIVRVPHGTARGTPNLHPAKESGTDRKHLLERCHRLQSHLHDNRFQEIFSDTVTEADEMHRNAGKKRSASP